jgi:hypothetical protein
MPARWFFAILFALLLAARLTHSRILWPDDTLPLAAAYRVARGARLYADVWFDKPPLVSWIYLAFGAQPGWPLRLAGAVYIAVAAAFAWWAARTRWSDREGRWAAGLTAFFLTFGLPSAVLPLASDSLLIAPHFAAIGCTWARRPAAAGVAAGVGLLASSKALFVAAACLVWNGKAAIPFALGAAVPCGVAAAWMAWQGSLAECWRQAFVWGRLYAEHTFVTQPLREGLVRSANWLGFHAALAAGAGVALRREADRWRWLLWLALAGAGVAAGLRFFPRYYFLLLAPLVLAAARGAAALSATRRGRFALAVLLVIPAARFGPRYLTLALDRDPEWSDTALDRDSRAVAALVRDARSLAVWGFRSEIFVYSGVPPASRFLETQPVSGVLADRHLFRSDAIAPEFVAPQRAEWLRSSPDVVVDALGPLNPAMALARQPWLADWISRYRESARTRYSVVYRLR